MGDYTAPFIVYALFSVLAIVVYGLDKLAARRGKRRVPEMTLHTIALVGGWPGAMLAMQLFRHKTRKRGFVLITWAIALLHVAAWVFVLESRGFFG